MMTRVKAFSRKGKRYVGVTDAAEIAGITRGYMAVLLKRGSSGLGFQLDIRKHPKTGSPALAEGDARLLKDGHEFLKQGVRPSKRMLDRLPEHIQKVCLERPVQPNRRFRGFF